MGSRLTMTGAAIIRTLLNTGHVSQYLRGVAVTFETRCHCELRDLTDDIRRLDMSMTIDTVDPSVDMDAMIEVGKIRQLVDSFPRKRYSLFEILCQLDDFRFVLAGDGVTVHTYRNSGDSSVRRRSDSSVTVLAVNPHRPCVKLVGKSYRLDRGVPYAITLSAREKIGDHEGG